MPTSPPFTRDGQPVRRFLKDLIAVGAYRHPAEGWTLEVTPERIDRWALAFERMRRAGVDVAVVMDHRLDAEATLGYLVEMFRWGDRLFGVHELVGEDALALAGRVRNVSVLIERDYVDGKGVRYGEAITHSSLVQRPLVPGQEAFVPMAASAGSPAAAPILHLQPAGGVLEPLDPPADPETIESLAEGAELRLEALVERGVLSPAVAGGLRELLVGDGTGRRNAYALSRRISSGGPSLAMGVLRLLEQNRLVPRGERTGGQCRVLARIVPGLEEEPATGSTTREMIRMASGRKEGP